MLDLKISPGPSLILSFTLMLKNIQGLLLLILNLLILALPSLKMPLLHCTTQKTKAVAEQMVFEADRAPLASGASLYTLEGSEISEGKEVSITQPFIGFIRASLACWSGLQPTQVQTFDKNMSCPFLLLLCSCVPVSYVLLQFTPQSTVSL